MQFARVFAIAIGFASTGGMSHAVAQSFTSPVSVNAAVGSRPLASALTMNMTGVGSGTNGPETAQFGTDMSCLKNNYFTPQSTIPGDLNCFNVNVQQGGPNSDARGVVINVQNTGLGFSNGFEGATTIAPPPNFAVPLYVDDQLADVTSDGGMAGAVFNSTVGTGQSGIYINTQGSASWKNLLQASKTGKVYFTITGSGNIVTSGSVTTASIVTSKIVQAASFPVSSLSGSKAFKRADCGTTLRSLDNEPFTVLVPQGLPVGCRIDVIQASGGTVTFEGKGMQAEHLGTPDRWQVKTDGFGAQAEILIDTPKTFLLTGEVGSARQKALALVSDVRPAGASIAYFLPR